MRTKTISMRDLYTLCRRYVPIESRHPNSFGDESWWWAHEIGHLITVPFSSIGKPAFGLELELGPDHAGNQPRPDRIRQLREREHELRCRELAAMRVSQRLLIAAGRPDLASNELDQTDATTLRWDARGRVDEILIEHKCRRIPTTRRTLEKHIERVVVGG